MAETNGHSMTVTAEDLRTFASTLTSRWALANALGYTHAGDRDIAEVAGYKRTLSYADYKAAYKRNGLAQRLVRVYPDATWGSFPFVTEEGSQGTTTQFEQQWASLVSRLDLASVFHRLDVLANLGHFAILLLGLRDQVNLREPAQPVRGPDDLVYVEVYSEEFAEVLQFEGNMGLPTFGQPSLYQINTGAVSSAPELQRPPPRKTVVHASRVIHVAADDLLDDTIYGIPWLEPIYDRLQDTLKVLAGSGEIFWRNAKGRITVETRDGYTLSAEMAAKVTDKITAFMHNMEDFLPLDGLTAKQLEWTIADPSRHFDMFIDFCCMARNIPKRKLLGSERGELASTQDDRNWKEAVLQRAHTIKEPRQVRPFLERLIALKVLATPANLYVVDWGDPLALSEKDRATVARETATALNQYAPGMAEMIVPAPEFRETYLGLPPESPYAVADEPLLLPAPEET